MRATKWMSASVLGIFLLTASTAMAQGNGKGHGKGHDKHGDDDDQGEHYYNYHDQDTFHECYVHNENHLPPGLEKQLVRRGILPPRLQKRIQPCSRKIEYMLPPSPPDCAHVVIGGHFVLLNRRTNVVVDIFHFEM